VRDCDPENIESPENACKQRSSHENPEMIYLQALVVKCNESDKRLY